MSTLHVNPETGEIGRCSARKRCPFGGPEIHFSNADDARVASEAILAPRYRKPRERGKLIIYVGLPGSGKSTLAAAKVKELDAVELNRDDTRTALFGKSYHDGNPDGKSEAKVTEELNSRLISVLRRGGVAIDSNTNTNPRFLQRLIQKALDLKAEVEIITVNVPLDEVKKRNAARGNSGGRLVPEHVIDQMANKIYSADGNIKDVLFNHDSIMFVDKFTEGMKLTQAYSAELEERYPILSRDIALVDIDGTLSFNHDALYEHITGPHISRKDWRGFFTASASSPANESVLDVLRRIRAGGLTIFALTGRQDDSAEATIEFLRNADAPISRVTMARQGDFRGDYSTKNTAADRLEAEGFTIVHSVDDRPSSIKVWEDRGILVSRVPEPLVGDNGKVTAPLVNSFVGEGYCLKCGLDIDGNQIIHDTCRSTV